MAFGRHSFATRCTLRQLEMITGIMPILTPFASIGIAIIMALAFAYHIRRKEYKDIPATIIFFAVALFIAYNRL